VRDFVQQRVTQVATFSSIATQTAMKSITDRPVIFGAVANPYLIGAGTSPTAHRPNVTGAEIPIPVDSALAVSVVTFPKVGVWGTLFDPADPFAEFYVDMAKRKAERMGIRFVTIACTSAQDIPASVQALRAQGVGGILQIPSIMIGGGFPARYLRKTPKLESYGRSIFRALRKHFGNAIPETIIEPGRGLVGNAGVIEAEVVLISRKAADDPTRWVYLDIGKFGGLAETMDESIRYAIRTPRDGGEVGPCVLAGPTCDSADVLYEKRPYDLPISIEIGDKVLIEGTGAYTATYAAVAFNGFAPLRTYHI